MGTCLLSGYVAFPRHTAACAWRDFHLTEGGCPEYNLAEEEVRVFVTHLLIYLCTYVNLLLGFFKNKW